MAGITEDWVRTAVVDRWVDGDTCEVTVDLGMRISVAATLRLNGIDTPELRSSNIEERERAKLARQRANELAPVDSRITIRTQKPDPKDKFGRWLAVIVNRDGVSVADVLIGEGLGKPYDGGKRIQSGNA